MILLERDRHKIGKMFYFWLIYFFLVFRSGSFSCISDKKASESVRVQARDYLLKIFRSRWVAGNRQSDPISVFDQRYLLIRLWYLRGFLVLQFFTLIFVIKGVPRRGGGGASGTSGGCSRLFRDVLRVFRSVPGLFHFLQTPLSVSVKPGTGPEPPEHPLGKQIQNQKTPKISPISSVIGKRRLGQIRLLVRLTNEDFKKVAR